MSLLTPVRDTKRNREVIDILVKKRIIHAVFALCKAVVIAKSCAVDGPLFAMTTKALATASV
jgi:hypothetical protein